jgi:hypothetical protein
MIAVPWAETQDDHHCAWCGRQNPRSWVDSAVGLAMWNRACPAKPRERLPVCGDNDSCPFRLGMLLALLSRGEP